MQNSIAPAVRRALIVFVSIFTAAANAAPVREDAMRLLDASGFAVMLRDDASRDGTLAEPLPSFLPPELRTEMVRAIDRSTEYAGMRKSMAEALAARFDRAAVDQQLRWWASTSGKSVSAAHAAAFHELTDPKARPAAVNPSAAALELAGESPYSALLNKVSLTSRRASECLQMAAAFRRICPDVNDVKATLPAGILIANYSKLTDADIAAFRAHLKTPGAGEAAGILADAYLQTRAKAFAEAQRAMEGALARFAREKIRGKADAEALLQAAISRIDERGGLDEVTVLLHLLRHATPRDARVFVELTRVSIKQGAMNRRSPPGQPGRVDPDYLDDAQIWMNRAIALEPKRADTLVLAGHLAYLKFEFEKSISLLEQARSIGTNNPWLGLNLADALWAQGQRKKEDRALLERAAQEYSEALRGELSAGMRWQANHSLAHVYTELHDLPKARAQYQKLLAERGRPYQREAFADYANFLFFSADDLDAAIVAARQASALGGSEDDDYFLAQVLLVKAEKLYANKQATDSAKLVEEARQAVPGIERSYARFAILPRTLPAVFAMKHAGLIGDLSSSEGGLTLVYACGHASAADVERLIRERANPNYLHPDEGTPLSRAIMARNLPALKVLLAHGADTTTKDHQGLLPLKYAEMIMQPAHPKDAEVLATLRSAEKGGAAAEPVGAPLKPGYVYQSLQKLSGDRFGHDLAAGTRVTFHDYCTYSDENLECLKFRHPTIPGAFLDVALEKVQLVSWQEWFKEIGPAAAPSR